MNRKRFGKITCLLILLLLIAFPFWATYRQAQLDHALILAIKTRDDQKTLELLEEGANGETRENEKPPTLQMTLLRLLNSIRPLHTPPSYQAKDDKHLSAALLFYRMRHNDRAHQDVLTSLVFVRIWQSFKRF